MDCDDSVQPPVDQVVMVEETQQADGDRNNLRKPNSPNPASTVSQQNTLHEEQQDAIKENHETPITPSVSDSIKNQNNEYVVEINVELAALMSENSKQPNPIVTEPRAPYTPSNSNRVNETHASHFKESRDRINDTIANHLNEPRDAHEAVRVSLKHEHLRVLPSWTRRARQGVPTNNEKFEYCSGQKRSASTCEFLPELPKKRVQVSQVEDGAYFELVEAGSQPR
nr:hypothetical protein CFP56_19970 [Quercus suber]